MRERIPDLFGGVEECPFASCQLHRAHRIGVNEICACLLLKIFRATNPNDVPSTSEKAERLLEARPPWDRKGRRMVFEVRAIPSRSSALKCVDSIAYPGVELPLRFLGQMA